MWSLAREPTEESLLQGDISARSVLLLYVSLSIVGDLIVDLQATHTEERNMMKKEAEGTTVLDLAQIVEGVVVAKAIPPGDEGKNPTHCMLHNHQSSINHQSSNHSIIQLHI